MSTHRSLRVTAKEEVADQVVSLVLEDAEGSELPAWLPGAHIDIELANGVTRQYSLCGDPADGHWRIAVLREPEGRGGSAFVHDELVVDGEVRTQGPRNHFEFVDADSYLFVAGGIGITPLLPMIEAATRAGAPWRLLYGGRTRPSMAFADTLLESHSDRVTLAPADEVGLLDLESALGGVDDGCVVYCCGPEPLLLAIEDVSHRLGVRLHVERFTAKSTPDNAVDSAFEVELAQSGQVIQVGSDESILSAVLDAGIDADFSCREGTCGTCEVGVLSGDIDHRDSVLDADEAAEGDAMMICVSRCTSKRLVIDL
ncbi:PDR/VanB family oxidoreductase [Gordonia sp. HY442]|uniref:PDR/VanB family oxidoreductase n=1 Tax=Gordonia zhenghanii TaxID=2911516 RepID=UPI001F41377C|nr:PDR/VanB family oxidoreductase [Gordonia zhenghanii]MCF8601977.1 PDR/VanB family oxidoreductase [Gordonia zhenghanii]MCF8602045.1 PDR/VanB family oxidoreductase [Gordonia zhenghanii]